MAKKRRRNRRRSVRKDSTSARPVEAQLTEPVDIQKVGKQAVSNDAELEEEYAYVVGDLRRVFILAAFLFLLLIALNLLLG